MAAPTSPTIRTPAVAGRFYPSNPLQCRAEAESHLKPAQPEPSPAGRWIGGIVPHAGWICSGAVAGQAIATIAKQQWKPDVVIVFGAVHTPVRIQYAALDSHQKWSLPGNDAELAGNVQDQLKAKGNLFAIDDRMHAREHAVEVVLPMVQLAFPNVPVVPIEIPAITAAEMMGRKTAQSIREAGLKAIYLASSDLTHYGPNYGFAPAGVGPAGIKWSMDNDRRLLMLVEQMTSDRIVFEASQNYNACGAGAIAAMLAACREEGADTARVLWHTNSYETLAKVAPQPPTNAVGYASVVVG